MAQFVGEFGPGPFGSRAATVGSSAASISGTAALLLTDSITDPGTEHYNNVIQRGITVVAAGVGSSQVKVLGGLGNGVYIFASPISLNDSVTLQASPGATVIFSDGWISNGTPHTLTIGSAGNNGTVKMEAFPGWNSGEYGAPTPHMVNVVNGRAELFVSYAINPSAPVTVGSLLGSAVLNLNQTYYPVSQTLSNLSFAGNSGSITGGTLHLTGTVVTSGMGHAISSLVALDAPVTFSGSGELLVSGVVSGSYSLTKTGSGTLILSAANVHGGTITINGGVVRAENVSAFGSGDIVVNVGGTLDKNGFAINNTVINNGGVILN